MPQPRRVAQQLLQTWERGESFAADLINSACRSGKIAPRDRPLVQQLLYTAIRNRSLLDHFIDRLADGKLDPKTRRILQLGLAEALLLDFPAHAVVNEAVKLAAGWSKGLVNAILRRALAEKQQLLAEMDSLPPQTRWSNPPWLWERWVEQFGQEAAAGLCEWNNRPAEVFVRTNPLKPDAPAIGQSSGLEPIGAGDFRRVTGELPKDWLDQGLVYAQDPSTAAAIDLLELKPGLEVLDACAAPGGKTFAAAGAMQNSGRIVATDRDPRRVERMRKNLERLGVEIAETRVVDWSEAHPGDLGQFDRILLDAPCSNTGVIRRRVDVRWRLKPSEFDRLRKLQQQLLAALSPLLKRGGLLVYSTCSIDQEENDDVVRSFLETHSDFAACGEPIQSVPSGNGYDGAFAIAMRRT